MKRGEPPSSTSGAPSALRPGPDSPRSAARAFGVSCACGCAWRVRRRLLNRPARARVRLSDPIAPPEDAQEVPHGHATADERANRPRLLPGRARDPERLPHQRRRRTRRILAQEGVFDAIVSLAGILGRPVRNQAGQEIGRLEDVVARWADGQVYPPVSGLLIRVGRRLAFVPASAIDRVGHAEVPLRSSRLDLRDVVRRSGEVLLARDVLDHQLVDVEGVQVIRAADLYLAEVLGRIRLVGADVSTATLFRRLGPRRWRPRPTPDRVIDWAAIQPFSEPTDDGEPGHPGAPETTNEGLHRLRPGELADLLEDLRRDERRELLAALSPDEAADALEEMQAEDLSSCCASRTRWRRRACWPPWSPTRRSTRCATCPWRYGPRSCRHIPAGRRSSCVSSSATRRTRPAAS